jgi:hypothetical protein
MARKAIGNATDYYRLRVIRMDESDTPEMEWREDILWRRPPSQHIEEVDLYRVEAVSLDDDDDVTALATFESADDAADAIEEAQEALGEMTKSEFEDTYFPEGD